MASTQFAVGEDVDSIFSFEAGQQQGVPTGWSGGPQDTLSIDEVERHEGSGSGRITRTKDSARDFSSLTIVLPADVEGEILTLKAWVRSKGVDNYFGLWMRQDGRIGPVDFVNNYGLRLKGDLEWQKVSVSTKRVAQAQHVFFGLVLGGAGTVWIDSVELLVDGKPYADAPKAIREELPWEMDMEFDSGSGIGDLELTADQVRNIATLIEIWGFVKYHHPKVAVGDIQIDFELFRVLPKILAADSEASRNQILLNWVQGLGRVDACVDCAIAAKDTHLDAPIEWTRDTELLGDELVEALRSIYFNRSKNDDHILIGQVPEIGNPVFDGELPYTNLENVDAGFRLLALARLWNIVQYWFPYRDLIDTPWRNVLRTAIPRLTAPLDADGYALEMIRVIEEIDDTHANLWGSLHLRPPVGDCVLKAGFRFVEGEATVWALQKPNSTGLMVGDVLTKLDGRTVVSLVSEWSPFYAASNQPTRLRDIGQSLAIGPCGKSRMQVRRKVDGVERRVDVVADRTERDYGMVPGNYSRDRAGDTYQELSEDISYIKLSSIVHEDVEEIVRRAQGKTGLVVDIRNYPSAFIVFELGQRLIRSPQPFARFTRLDLSNPGAFVWSGPVTLHPVSPTFDGKVAILVDESSQSQAEYTAMALRVHKNAFVVGSTTAGADGDVSSIMLPGGLRTMISGIGVFYPDKTPTQRIGIVPDIKATPTIDGVRDGRDEVLEAALKYILGDSSSHAEIKAMAMRP